MRSSGRALLELRLFLASVFRRLDHLSQLSYSFGGVSFRRHSGYEPLLQPSFCSRVYRSTSHWQTSPDLDWPDMQCPLRAVCGAWGVGRGIPAGQDQVLSRPAQQRIGRLGGPRHSVAKSSNFAPARFLSSPFDRSAVAYGDQNLTRVCGPRIIALRVQVCRSDDDALHNAVHEFELQFLTWFGNQIRS